ncbi:MAG TPA: hypothetical protein VG078_07900 [Acidimicrobiales bacterium]|nr:hypothetical protein [Acidimicrobiales bacterium]
MPEQFAPARRRAAGARCSEAVSRRARTAVYVELGRRRAFAGSLDWPGWCRSGKGEEAALETLAAYADRYAPVAAEAGIRFPADAGETLRVVERLPGGSTTDFGAPQAIAGADRRPLSRKEAERHAALVEASWAVFDRVVATAPATLRKGPRGGGRDRDAIVDHVLGAEAGYARTLGVRHRQPARDDTAAVTALRDAIAAALRMPSTGEPLTPKGWPPRYAARRIAWHVLDHAWEIEDKSA